MRRYSTQQNVDTKMLWRKANSKLFLNTLKINDIHLQLLFGLTQHSTKQYLQMLHLRLINRNFPKSHRLHKVFNRNTVKVSYSCMQNMSKIYKGHNSKISSTPCNQLILCYCRKKEKCPMDGKWQTMDAVYDCSVTSPELQKIYFGLAEG